MIATKVNDRNKAHKVLKINNKELYLDNLEIKKHTREDVIMEIDRGGESYWFEGGGVKQVI